MLTGGRLIFAALLLGATTTAAMAQDKGGFLPGTVSGNVALTNDYVFRGFTQTQQDVAIQGGLDWDTGHGFYIGAWASNVQFGVPGEGDVELDLYGGYRGSFGKFTYDVGAIGYLYPGTDKALNYNWWEASAKVGYDFGLATVGASVNYTPDFFGGLGDGWYYAGKVTVPLAEGLSVDGTIGLQDLEAPFDDIVDYSLGVTYAIPQWFTADVRFVDTDAPSGVCLDICDSRWVFKISRSFEF